MIKFREFRRMISNLTPNLKGDNWGFKYLIDGAMAHPDPLYSDINLVWINPSTGLPVSDFKIEKGFYYQKDISKGKVSYLDDKVKEVKNHVFEDDDAGYIDLRSSGGKAFDSCTHYLEKLTFKNIGKDIDKVSVTSSDISKIDRLVYSKTLSGGDRLTYDIYKPEIDETTGKYSCKVVLNNFRGHRYNGKVYMDIGYKMYADNEDS